MSGTERYASLGDRFDDAGLGMLLLLAGVLSASLVALGYLVLTVVVAIPVVGMRILALRWFRAPLGASESP